jgi:hypothetical protein
MWRRTHPFLPSFLLSASYFKKPKNSRSDDAASLDTEKNIKSKSYAKESVFRSYFFRVEIDFPRNVDANLKKSCLRGKN